jgi:Na+:H+ antiporter, NhaA family
LARFKLRRLFKVESAEGIVLFASACLALILANSALAGLYVQFLDVAASVRIDGLGIEKPLLLWVNDGLMAVFFLFVALEVKREVVEGELSRISNAALPAVAAVGGMVGPTLLYVALNISDGQALRGWAIPTATDIAFALGVLALLGSRVPPALKVFLLALAIIDDLGAILIIAAFYTDKLSPVALVLASVGVGALVILNLSGVSRRAFYLLGGIFIWVCVLKSGIHATLAGVVVGLTIPLHAAGGDSPLRRVESDLRPWVAFGVLPSFAFANAGLRFADVTLAGLLHPIQLGIFVGLLVGKPLGVIASIWAAVRVGRARTLEGVSWTQLYGMAFLTGIGFTMSLFIGTLAFPSEGYDVDVRVAVLSASVVSAAIGYTVLRIASRRQSRASLSGSGADVVA